MKKELVALHKLIEEEQSNICEIAVMKQGKMVLEDCFHEFKPEAAFHVMSVTKSVVSLLIGIAIDKGYIKSVDQSVLDFFPDYTKKRGEHTIDEVTLRHLLTMTAPYKYKSEPWTKVCTSGDWTKAALDLLGGKKGITGEFKYSTLGVQILMGIIANASGMSTMEFANRYLFLPIGVKEHKNREDKSAEEQMAFFTSKSDQGDTWFADPKGVNTAGWGLCLSARDMARIGQMCLEHGRYNGQQIVSSEWIDAIATPYYHCDERFGNMSYGFLWWIIDEAAHTYAAIGDGGNVIYVNPSKELVVSITAMFKPRVFDRVQLIQEEIEPLFTEEPCSVIE